MEDAQTPPEPWWRPFLVPDDEPDKQPAPEDEPGEEDPPCGPVSPPARDR